MLVQDGEMPKGLRRLVFAGGFLWYALAGVAIVSCPSSWGLLLGPAMIMTALVFFILLGRLLPNPKLRPVRYGLALDPGLGLLLLGLGAFLRGLAVREAVWLGIFLCSILAKVVGRRITARGLRKAYPRIDGENQRPQHLSMFAVANLNALQLILGPAVTVILIVWLWQWWPVIRSWWP